MSQKVTNEEFTPTQLKRKNAKERDAKFREFVQRQDIIDEAATLKKSKRIGHMKERFEAETGYKIPLSMVYKNMNKVYPKSEPIIDQTINESTIKFDSSDAIEVPISGDSEGETPII